MCFAEDALLGIVPQHEAWQTYTSREFNAGIAVIKASL